MKKNLDIFLFIFIYIKFIKFKIFNKNNMIPGWHLPYIKNSKQVFLNGHNRYPNSKNLRKINLTENDDEIYPLK